MESHDEQWLMFKNIAFGNSSADYNIRDLPTALDRMKLAGAFFLHYQVLKCCGNLENLDMAMVIMVNSV